MRQGVGLRRGVCLCAAAWMAALLLSAARATEDLEEVSLADASYTPYVYVVAPAKGVSYDDATSLTVQAGGEYAQSMELELVSQEGTQTFRSDSGEARHTFTFESPQTQGALLIVRGYGAPGADGTRAAAELRQEIPSPKEELIEKMIALAYANSKDRRYKFAPAETDSDIGVCKNFVMRLFDTFSQDYRMLAYPELALHMPVNNSKKNCAPYDYGIEWKPETAADGSPFEIAAQFKYDDALSQEENAELARQLLVQIRKGDFFQIVGYYGGGNGPHSMYIIADYDSQTEMIRWTDSNMRGTRIDGVRWGYMQYDADAPVDWWIDVFNRKKRGATLYRLRDDLYHK
ncbi:MAG: hypothetical protein VB099_19495 [Candidatus Limiplasma sp.]|nr:hypothetical protein [Candidatus Limiplasma sp.]